MTTRIELIKKHIAMIAAIHVVAIWGETFVSSKVLLEHGLKPADIFFYRFTLAYICMWFVSRRRLMADSVKDETLFVALGVLGGSLYFLFENMALVYSTASNVAILVGSAPLITALVLAIFYKDERMHGIQIAGSAIAFLGMVMVITNGQLILHLNPLGDALALGAALTWSLYSLVIKNLSEHYDSAFITRKVFAYGLITILPYFLLHPLNTDPDTLAQPVVWVNLLYLAFIASMGCFLAWNWALTKLGTVRTTNIIYLQSLFTMFISAMVLHETITIVAIAGAVILIAGMVLAAKKRK